MLGVTMGLSLLCSASAMITWGKKLLPEEIAVQERHDGPSDRDERKLTGADHPQHGRRAGRQAAAAARAGGPAPAWRRSASVAAAPLVGGLIKNPHRRRVDGEQSSILTTTGWDPPTTTASQVRSR